MPVPNQIDDGNWNLLIREEGGRIEFPFSDVGDNTSWIQYLKYKQNRQAFRPRSAMTQVQGDLGMGYLVKQGNPQDVGNNLIEWEDVIATKPLNRTEYGTFNYTLQWWARIADTGANPDKYFYNVTYDITEQTFTVAAQFEYEYFLNIPPEPLIKPRVFMVFGVLNSIGGTPILGNRLVAEDSTINNWMGKIFVRRTTYVHLSSTGTPLPT